MNHIITYFYIEDNRSSSQYGVQEKNFKKKNEYYFRCILNFFASSIYFNNECKHYFIINNIKNIEHIPGFNFRDFCEKNNIELIEKKTSYVKSQKKWAGSMYFFDALNAIIEQNNLNSNDNYFFFDNDIIFNNNLSQLINKKNFDYLVYNINHEYKIDDLWIHDFNGINLHQIPHEFIPYGGEFIGIKGNKILTFMKQFNLTYKDRDFITEEHYISYILSIEFKNKYNILDGNDLLKRCWTTYKHNNISIEDKNFAILHLPSEKEYGLYWYSKKYIKTGIYEPNTILSYCSIIPRPNILKVKVILKKFFTRIKNKKYWRNV